MFANATRICIPESLEQDQPLRVSDLDGARYSGNLHADLITPRGQDSTADECKLRESSDINHVEPHSSAMLLRHTPTLETLQESRTVHSSWKRAGLRAVAVAIAVCFSVHTLALLVFCSSIYQTAIEPWILRRIEPFLQPYQSRQDVAAFAYLLCCGVAPTILAGVLWHVFKHNRELHESLQSNRFASWLRHKPSFSLPSRWRARSSPPDPLASHNDGLSPAFLKSQLYVDATRGDIAFLLLLLVVCTAVLIQVLVADGISSISSASTVLRALGKSFGYMCLLTMTWLLFTLDKTSFWMAFVRLPHPLSAKYRRWLGVLTLIFAIAHCVCHASNFYLRHQFVSQLVPHFGAIYQETPIRDANGINAFGEVALAAIVAMGAASVPAFRKRWYTVYLSVQQGAGAVAVLAVCVHFPQALWWLFPALVMLVTQRVVAGHHARYPVEIVDMAPLPNGVTRLVCRRRLQRTHRHRAFTPGQFVFLYASRISWFQWHPFYVASSPSAHRDTFRVYIQAAGDWTESFFDLSKLAYATQEAPLLFADGFYGPSLPNYYEQYERLVLLAEGIGVTGVMAMLEELFFVAQTQQAPGSGSSQRTDAQTKTSGDDDERQVWFLWVCKDTCLFKEFEDLLLRIRAFDPSERRFRIRLFLTKAPTARDLEYMPPAPCDFQTIDDLRLETTACEESGVSAHHLVGIQAHSAAPTQPQNRSGWCIRISARPFQAAVASPVYQVLVLATVFAAALVLAVHVEWQDHQHGSGIFGGEALEKEGMFRPMHRAACVVVIFAGCYSAYVVIACEEVGRMVRERMSSSAGRTDQAQANRGEHMLSERVAACTTTVSATTTSSTTHWIEMSPHTDDVRTLRTGRATCTTAGRDPSSADFTCFGRDEGVNETTSSASASDEPDIVDKLRITFRRPDLDSFLASVSKRVSASSCAPTVGVFASGNPKFLDVVDDAAAQADAVSELATRTVAFRVHRFALR